MIMTCNNGNMSIILREGQYYTILKYISTSLNDKYDNFARFFVIVYRFSINLQSFNPTLGCHYITKRPWYQKPG